MPPKLRYYFGGCSGFLTLGAEVPKIMDIFCCSVLILGVGVPEITTIFDRSTISGQAARVVIWSDSPQAFQKCLAPRGITLPSTLPAGLGFFSL